jgi:hypothetical protein
VPEPLLQRQLAHAALPHRGGVGVPQRAWGLVRRSDAEPVQPAGEPARDGLIAQRLAPAGTAAADQEHERALRIQWAFVQHVAVDRVQGARLVQVHHPLVTCLRTGAARMIVTPAHRNPAAAVGNVVQLQAQHLARTQPAVEH